MTIQQCLRGALLSAMAAGSLLPTVRAAEPAAASGSVQAFGAIVGMVTNAARLPVAHATVTAVRRDGGGIRATLSGSDGTYAFNDLPPGSWTITAEVDGAPAMQLPPLLVQSNKATRYDIVLTGAPASGPALAAAPAPAPAAPPAAAVPPATPAVRSEERRVGKEC